MREAVVPDTTIYIHTVGWVDILLDVIGGVESALREGCPRTVAGVSQCWFSGTSQELEAGGSGEMCLHARLILTWSAGYIMTPR